MVKEMIVTIGVFDGVHRGHRALIEELLNIAQLKKMAPMVITFNNKPSSIIDPQRSHLMLSSQTDKRQLLESLGVSDIVFLDFNHDIAKMSAKDFLLYISKSYNIKAMLMGHDHIFGSDRITDLAQYVAIGNELDIEVIKSKTKIFDNDRERISSSKIRHLISSGNVLHASELLGYFYILRGNVVEGMKIGRTIGYPTANIVPDIKNKLLPHHGVYAVFAVFDGKKYPAMLYIGRRPTLDNGTDISIEVNIFDINVNLYSRQIEVEFIDFVREDCRFKDLSELKNRIYKDEQEVRKILSKYF